MTTFEYNFEELINNYDHMFNDGFIKLIKRNVFYNIGNNTPIKFNNDNPNITSKIVYENLDMNWSIWDFNKKQEELLTSEPYYNWDRYYNYNGIPHGSSYTWDYIKKIYKGMKIDLDYNTTCDWKNISQNKNMTWEIICDNPELPWDWEFISSNTNITWEIIENNLDKNWNWENIMYNSMGLGKEEYIKNNIKRDILRKVSYRLLCLKNDDKNINELICMFL